MSYIDALFKKDEDRIYVVERDPKKGRASAAQRKRRQDPNPNRRGKAKNVATKKK